MRRTIGIAIALAVVPLVGRAGTLPATGPVDRAVIGALWYTFLPGDDDTGMAVEIEQGTKLTFVNSDPGGSHTVTAVSDAPGVALFETQDEVPTGSSADVAGVEALTPGTYHFYCAVHYLIMWGTLVVTPRSSP